MPARKHNFTLLELKAGVMVIASAVVLAVFIAAIAGALPKPRGNTYVVYFNDTLGLNVGADVRFGGVKVGRVTRIEADQERADSTALEAKQRIDEERKLASETATTPGPGQVGAAGTAAATAPGPMLRGRIIRVTASIFPDALAPVNAESRAYIGQTTLTAEKHLEITTGLPSTGLLADGSEIETGIGGGIFDQAGAIAANLESGIKSVQALIGVEQAMMENADGKLDTTLVTLLRSVDNAVVESKDLVGDVRTIMSSQRSNIGSVIDEVLAIEQSAQLLLAELNGMISESRPQLQNALQQAPLVIQRIDALAENLETVVGSLQGLVDTSQDTLVDNRPAVEETIIELRETVSNLKNFSRGLAEQPESVLWGKSNRPRRGE
jgi:ABC-type transporter Mla subunit MlaD